MSLLACKICKMKVEQRQLEHIIDEWEDGSFYKKREFFACKKCAEEYRKQKIDY